MASAGDAPRYVQYAPFSSFLDAGFWHNLSQLKLDVLGLDDTARDIHGFYVNGDAPGLPCRLNIDYTAFESEAVTPPRSWPACGMLKNTNTMEDFKTCDKRALLEEQARLLWEDITSGRAIQNPTRLSKFFVLTFADLKKYHYYYWFAFPAVCAPETVEIIMAPKSIEQRFSAEQIQSFLQDYDQTFLPNHVGYFIAQETDDVMKLGHLKDVPEFAKTGKVILCVCDPCTLDSYPGWPLRNLMSLAAYHWADLFSELEVICFRDRSKEGIRDLSHSLVLTVRLTSTAHLTDCPKSVGWEKNERQKMGPRMVNLSTSMDPTKLASSAVDLNLKLMRWRLLPELNLDKVAGTRCLLLGAGTLGCNVARCLLGWGVRHITFVDNGKISYSNPVRQSLFNFEDSLGGGKHKAEAASEAVRKIFPGVKSQGIPLSIPMPGHPIPDNLVEQTRKDVALLEELVDNHDVVFLLMDTRESRWLPTVMGAAKHKIVMNAALGFDTFLALRHGLKVPPSDAAEAMDTGEACAQPLSGSIPGEMLGCYFCNDVVAPGDSTRDRTLDQQCTVSRPGMSMLTSALVVELLVTLLQHPLGGQAPADMSLSDDYCSDEGASPLGLVPHQIRGFLSRYQILMPASRAFDKCTACSPVVCQHYRDEGFDFLLNAFNSPSYLEDLTGLSQLHAETQDAEVWELSDDESIQSL